MNGRAPSASSFNYQWTYDVFINFRGEDTRYGFTGNLYNALCRKGIRTFMDDEELNKGEEITPTILKAIEQSRMAIVIFSKNYASSTFCLDELVKILQYIRGKDRLVWPIFYNVVPSEVRHQKGDYEEALSMHQKRFKASKEKVQEWKMALQEASNISGIHVKLGHEYEYQLIERIVKDISSKINRTPLHIANYPVGLETRVLEVKSLLRFGSNDEVNIIGICGIGGMGKSTIAHALYNLVADQFEGLCFLHDIKEESRKHGLARVQEMMLLEIIGENIKVGNANKGVTIIKRRFNKKKILLILDNVDKEEQLEKLAGDYDWFGSGSRIIITTRDKHLLARHGVERIYEVKKFNKKESFELLSWSAFKNNQVVQNYTEVLNYVIEYADGLPLALEVIGSHLFGKSIKEWKSLIDIYKRIPNKEIQQILKVSYDELGEAEQKIFLDIACFFKGKHLEYVIDMEEHAHGFDPSYGIGVLIDKCLIKNEYNTIRMHDLIQDMGREIVRQESPIEPGKRSRLWFYEDIIHVLENDIGTDQILIIGLECLSEAIKINWNGKAFKKMKNLKILILDKAYTSEGPKYLPNSLRVLQWKGYSGSCLPPDFNPSRLAILNLPNSSLQSLEPLKRLGNVSILDLGDSKFITKIPDVSGLPNLTELILDYCENLIEIHDSVGYLEKLKILDVHRCENLTTFPRHINLPSLEDLKLEGCWSLERFPEILGKMEYITELDLSDTSLELPFSIRNLTALEELTVEYGKGLKLSTEGCVELSSMLFSSVKKVTLRDCDISDELLPLCLSWFANVEYLDLSGSNFTILPACINKCHFLEFLYLDNCEDLTEVKGLPPNIKELWATNCTSLSSESRSLLMSQESPEAVYEECFLPGSTIPEWFDHRRRRLSFTFWFRNKFPVISLCCLLSLGNVYVCFDTEVIINGEKLELSQKFCVSKNNDHYRLYEDHLLFINVSEWRFLGYFANNSVSQDGWNSIVSSLSEWNHVEIFISSRYHKLDFVKEVGLSLMKEQMRVEDVRFTNPHKRAKLLDDFSWGSSFLTSSWTNGTSSDKDAKSEEGNYVLDQSLKFTTKRNKQFCSSSNLRFEIAKVAHEGQLVDVKGAERFVQLMHSQNGDRVSDLSGRIMLVHVMAFTNLTLYLISIKGLPLLDKWIQDVQEGKFGDADQCDESIEDFLFTSLCVLSRLPVSLNDLLTCDIAKSVSLLCEHKSEEIQKKAQYVLDTWKRDIEMEIKEVYGARASSSSGFYTSEVPYDGNKLREGSVVAVADNPHTTLQGDSIDSYSSKAIMGCTWETEGEPCFSIDKEKEIKKKGKVEDDNYLSSMSNDYGSISNFGEQAIYPSHSYSKKDEAETNLTQKFAESGVDIGLVHACRKEDLTQTNQTIFINSNSLSWDPMEWEHQVACQKDQPVLYDQSTKSERDDDGMESETSDQRRDPWYFCLCAVFSSVLSLCSSTSATT